MIKQRANTILLMIVVLYCSISAMAESRTWTTRNGNTILGKYVKRFGESVSIRKEDGSFIKIRTANLSGKDLAYVELLNPPELNLKLKTDITKKSVRSSQENGNKSRRELKWNNTSTSTARCEVELKKTDLTPYTALLQLKLYWISGVKDKSGNTFEYFVAQSAEKPIRFDGKTRNTVWKPDPCQFVMKESVTSWDNPEFDPKKPQGLNNPKRRIRKDKIMFERYTGILAVVVDERGEVIAMSSENKRLEAIRDEIMIAKPKQPLPFEE